MPLRWVLGDSAGWTGCTQDRQSLKWWGERDFLKGDKTSETDNNTKREKPKIYKLSIWATIIVVIVGIAIAILFVALQIQILTLKTLLIFGAIFLPVIFFGRLLIEIILIFKKK